MLQASLAHIPEPTRQMKSFIQSSVVCQPPVLGCFLSDGNIVSTEKDQVRPRAVVHCCPAEHVSPLLLLRLQGESCLAEICFCLRNLAQPHLSPWHLLPSLGARSLHEGSIWELNTVPITPGHGRPRPEDQEFKASQIRTKLKASLYHWDDVKLNKGCYVDTALSWCLWGAGRRIANSKPSLLHSENKKPA